MTKSIEEVLVPKSGARPRIYATTTGSIGDEAHRGMLKIGQTTRDVKLREQDC